MKSIFFMTYFKGLGVVPCLAGSAAATVHANMFSQKWMLNFVCCDRCEHLYCNKCAHISHAGCCFLLSSETENVSRFCNTCKAPARTIVIKDKCIEDKCKEYADKLYH